MAGIATGITLGLALVIAIGALILYFHVRPPRTERLFVQKFAEIEAVGGVLGALDAFETLFEVKQNEEITKPIFMRSLALMLEQTPPSKGSKGKSKGKSKGEGKGESKEERGAGGSDNAAPFDLVHAEELWHKMDHDQSGKISVDEFLIFFYGLRVGQISINKWRARVKRLVAWWVSPKTQTLKFVLISHFQLMTSVSRNFPQLTPEHARTTDTSTSSMPIGSGIGSGISSGISNTTGFQSNGEDSSLASSPLTVQVQVAVATSIINSREALAPFFEAIGNANLEVIKLYACGYGPRHFDKLVAVTAIVLGLIVLAWLAVGILRCCKDESERGYHYASRATAEILFLTYPYTSAIILRTFACTKFISPDGKTGWWMEDDVLDECIAPWHTLNTTYARSYIYSVVMVPLFVVGLPILMFSLLYKRRYPFNTLFAANNDGHFVPSQVGEDSVGPLYEIFRSA